MKMRDQHKQWGGGGKHNTATRVEEKKGTIVSRRNCCQSSFQALFFLPLLVALPRQILNCFFRFDRRHERWDLTRNIPSWWGEQGLARDPHAERELSFVRSFLKPGLYTVAGGLNRPRQTRFLLGFCNESTGKHVLADIFSGRMWITDGSIHAVSLTVASTNPSPDCR